MCCVSIIFFMLIMYSNLQQQIKQKIKKIRVKQLSKYYSML